MSDSYGSGVPEGTDAGSTTDKSATIDTAKHEAAELKATTADKAKDVVGTAKDEASAVVAEAKSQAKQLYAQTQREVKDQANAQQQRLASGLQSVGHELDSMAANAEDPGLATDIVREVSGRVSSAASWLGERDPGAVVAEVKQYARRKPVTFIIAAGLAGLVVGRLVKALASNASDEKSAAPSRVAGGVDATPPDAWAAPQGVSATSGRRRGDPHLCPGGAGGASRRHVHGGRR